MVVRTAAVVESDFYSFKMIECDHQTSLLTTVGLSAGYSIFRIAKALAGELFDLQRNQACQFCCFWYAEVLLKYSVDFRRPELRFHCSGLVWCTVY